MLQVLVPAGVIAAVILVAAVVVGLYGPSGPTMSDGSNGGLIDPDLKEVVAGVKVRDLKEGEGSPPAQIGARIRVHYKGWLADGTVFDSTEGRAPFVCNLKPGVDGVILGWVYGIQGMRPGGIRKLVISPDKGYGNQGTERIPPNSFLIFEVHLLEILPSGSPNQGPGRPMSDGSDGGTEDLQLTHIGDGVRIRDLKVGEGNPVEPGATIVAHYKGWLPDGTVFDDSRSRNRGMPMTIELDNMIAGWRKGIVGMKPGGIRKLVIPPDMAYGSQGRGDIPPNATLIFEVELISVK
ncbi:MAG: FKBP-type peptidyl-prolyl cis-trans isomerase [Gemmataceae bacterium]|nr:FKBP-type peptidyl-prolyl cis-trans isomerase [Gemmataceae bacterium]